MELSRIHLHFLPRQRILGTGNRKYISFGQNQCLQRMLDGSEFAPQCEAYSVKRQRVQEPDGSVAEAPLPRAESLFGTRASRSRRYSAFKTSIITLEDVEALQTNISSPTTFIDRFAPNKRFKQHVTCANSSPRKSNRNSPGEENTPQSLAAGIVYFVIRLNDIPSRKQTFALSAM
jgi:hypothetical protein